MQREGTNLVLNRLRLTLFVGWPDGELHEVIRGQPSDGFWAIFRKGGCYLPVGAFNGDVFHPIHVPAPRLPAGIWGRLIG